MTILDEYLDSADLDYVERRAIEARRDFRQTALTDLIRDQENRLLSSLDE